MNKDVRKETLKYLDKKEEYSLIQSWSKWKWPKITTKQVLSRSEEHKKRIQPQTFLIRCKEVNVVSNKEKVLQMWSECY
jgi:hypothetical protein